MLTLVCCFNCSPICMKHYDAVAKGAQRFMQIASLPKFWLVNSPTKYTFLFSYLINNSSAPNLYSV